MKRLNIKLLIWLIVTPIVLGVGIHFLHAYQIDRNAGALKAQADDAAEHGDTEEAISLYSQFLKHRDDRETYGKLADLAADAAEKPNATRKQFSRAYQIMEEATRRHSKLVKVRERLIDYSMKIGRFGDAMEHIDVLRQDGQGKEAKFDVKYAQCLLATGREEKAVKLLADALGFDTVKQQFRDKPGPAAAESDAYVLLAEVYRRRSEDSKEAELVIDRMVAANPKSADALASRGRFRQRQKKLNEAEADLTKALELDPEDANILISAAEVAGALKHFEKAKDILNQGLKKHPSDFRVYRSLASLAFQQHNTADAMKYVEEGLAKSPGNRDLLLFRADLELKDGDIEGARMTVDQLRKGEFLPELIELIECRILVVEKKWSKASHQLERLRPLLARFPDQQMAIDMLLGQCYKSQGQPDKAIDAFRRALDADPASLPAQLGYADALRDVGKPEQAESVLQKLQGQLATREGFVSSAMGNTMFQMAVANEMRKTADQRDWSRVDSMLKEILATDTLSKPQKAVLEAEIDLFKQDFKHARAILSSAVKEYPKELAVWLGLVKLVNLDKSSNYSVDDIVDRAEKALGPVLQLQQIRLANAVRKEGKDALAAVQKVESDSKSLTPKEQAAFLSELGNAYYRLKDYEDTRRCWLKMSEQQPEDTKLLLTLFEIAQEFNNEADMNATLEKIQTEVGADSSLARFCEAERILWRIRQKKADVSTLAQARELLEKARKSRPDWHEIARLSAEIAELEGKSDEAIASYQKALELGPSNPGIARRLVTLLYLAGRMTEVDKAMDAMGQVSTSDPLKRIEIERDIREGKLDEALEDAQKVVEAEPENVANRIWYGQLLKRAGRDADAQAAFRAAVKKDPKFVQGWLLLVDHLSDTKQLVDAQAAIREAEAAIPAESRTAFLASAYEMAGDAKRAESNYLKLLEQKPNETSALRNLVSFYLRRNQPNDAKKYLNTLLALPAASNPKASDADRNNIAWARRGLAQVVAADGEYRSMQEALKIVEGNRVNGVLPPEDMMMSAGLLAKRPEYASRVKAIELLEAAQEKRSMSPDEMFAMAQLYEQTGNWSKARDSIINIVAKVPGNALLWSSFAQMLLKHNELTEAERWISKVEEAQPKSAGAIELRSRLLAKQGKPQEAADLLVTLLDAAPDEKSRLQMMAGVVALLEEFKQLVAAETILRKAISEHPQAKMALAAFLGRHGDLNETFEMLEQSRKSYPLSMIVQAGLEVLRRRSSEADKQQYETISAWLKSALADEPESLALRLQQAELKDIQGRPTEVISAYREMLNDKKLDPKQRAIIQNNLAFVLAMNGDSGNTAEALRLIDEAIAILGPSSDLLDTRAICYLQQGDNKQAIKDLQVAIIDSPSPVKYIHLAMAEAKAGDKAAARKSLDRARELKFEVNELSAKERQNFEKISREIEGK